LNQGTKGKHSSPSPQPSPPGEGEVIGPAPKMRASQKSTPKLYVKERTPNVFGAGEHFGSPARILAWMWKVHSSSLPLFFGMKNCRNGSRTACLTAAPHLNQSGLTPAATIAVRASSSCPIGRQVVVQFEIFHRRKFVVKLREIWFFSLAKCL
jgi:hypothetical protein